MTAQPAVNARQRYEALKAHREVFLDRARECAALTVPYLCPPAGFNATTKLPTPFQSLGARGVRTLASKLLLSLFPANTPFFKYSMDDLTLRALEQREGQQAGQRGNIERALAARERAVVQEMDGALFRSTAFVALQHLLVTGNFLIYVPPKGRSRGYRLDQYVVKRAPDGSLLEIVVHDKVSPATVETRLVGKAKAPKDRKTEEKNLDLFTHIVRDADGWVIYQELDGIEVPDSRGRYPLDKLPWLPLRLSIQPSEDYGRSYVEEYLGDLDSLEGLVETIVEGSSAVARVVFMVRPGGQTNIRLVTKARTGDVIPGDPEDVGTIQAQKQADLGVARQQAQEIAQGLAYAFMLNTAIQRQGERVTAEEIRYMSAELDAALGGVYTLLSGEFQLVAVSLFSDRMEKNRKVPPLPDGMVQPTIVTGMEAIGRGADQRNLKLFVSEIIQVMGPELALKFIKPLEFLKRAAASYGIDTAGLIPDEEELAQSDQQQMLMQLVQQLGPQGIQQLGGMVQTQMKTQAQAQQAATQPQEAPPNG